MKKDKKLQRIEALKYALENQIGWQRYAEGKNIILFTISGTTLISLLAFIYNSESYTFIKENFSSMKWILIFCIVTTIIAFTLTISSVFVNLFITATAKEFKDKTFFISWRHVKNKNQELLEEQVEQYSLNEQIADLVYQQRIGSKLTNKKYRYFNAATIFYLVGLLVFMLASILVLLGLI